MVRSLFLTTESASRGCSHFTTPSRIKCDVPSFDTPDRNLLSPGGFRSKVKDFVLGSGSYGTVVRGKYKSKFIVCTLWIVIWWSLIDNVEDRRNTFCIIFGKFTHDNVYKRKQDVLYSTSWDPFVQNSRVLSKSHHGSFDTMATAFLLPTVTV